MSFESIDALQNALTKNVFNYAKDPKKAAGRALGTLVELITFYLIKSWELERFLAIERRLPEFANPDITHNVEFSLHPSTQMETISVTRDQLPLTAKKILKQMSSEAHVFQTIKATQLLDSAETLRNACTLYEDESCFTTAILDKITNECYQININKLQPHPFAIIECKRVGVEDGNKKGPQTIEKAKQGAYVARSVSSLQKFRMADGSMFGILQLVNNELRIEPYDEILRSIIDSEDLAILKSFMLTVGVVSNHGNWFTSEDHNKELKVLAQSYDWLLFLSDQGLSTFVENLLINPEDRYAPIREAFAQSYTGKKGKNVFTKVNIKLSADLAFQDYFTNNLCNIEEWFNIISPAGASLIELKEDLQLLASKNWEI